MVQTTVVLLVIYSWPAQMLNMRYLLTNFLYCYQQLDTTYFFTYHSMENTHTILKIIFKNLNKVSDTWVWGRTPPPSDDV